MKQRLDQILVARGLAADVETARRFIGAGEVYVNEGIVDKVGTSISDTAVIRLKKRSPFVSRGGEKLKEALSTFDLTVEEKTCLDVGASTGGFTDCLLQHGAKKVFAVDVAYGQLDWKLRQDDRVVVIERCNARRLTRQQLNDAQIEVAVTDVSFISLTKILPAMIGVFEGDVNILALIKPQYELPYADIPAGGVVTNDKLHQKAIDKILDFINQWQHPRLYCKGVVPSPILGPKGNKEFLIHIISKDEKNA